MLAVYAARQSADDPLSGLEVGERPDHRERLLERVEAREERAPVLQRLEGDGDGRDDGCGAVVMDVRLGVLALEVHERGIRQSVHDVEGEHEVLVEHPVLDRAGSAGAA
jgi:hypothetical protein